MGTDSVLRFACPNCGVRLQSRASHSGKSVKCRKCEIRFTIPIESQATVKEKDPAIEQLGESQRMAGNQGDGGSPNDRSTFGWIPPVEGLLYPGQAGQARRREFSEWYRNTLGREPSYIQALCWVFYGFIWIPVWWWYSKRADDSKSRNRESVANRTAICPHCRSEITAETNEFSVAGECPFCCRLLSADVVAASSHRCPTCKSEDIKSFEYVHALGTSKSTTSMSLGTIGGASTLGSLAGAGLLGLGGAFARARIGNVSGLAELCAPPAKLRSDGFSSQRRKYNDLIYPKQLSIWRRSWICLGCGSHWVK